MPSMRSALVWQNPHIPEGRILIEPEPLALMDLYWQDRMSRPEAGGILLGYRREIHLHVTMATTPQPDDQGWRYFFKRSARYHQEIALKQWNDSDEKMDYLGEWHTHPEPQPSPSMLDLSEWRQICSRRPDPMAFLIMGWSGQLWMGLSRMQEITRCEVAKT